MLKYSRFLQNIYGEKVYKIPVSLPGTCPNRDGTKGVGGCIFCSERGAGYELPPADTDFFQQISETVSRIRQKYKANRYLIFFQNYTGTYMPLPQFAAYLDKVCTLEDVAGVSVATRPDCLDGGHLDVLSAFAQKGYDVFIELGLQSANDDTLKKINRGHTVADYIAGAAKVKAYGFYLDTHLILNLPWDTDDDILAAARLVNSCRTDSVKLHSLHIPYHTPLYEMYRRGEITLLSKEEYFHRLYLFLRELSPHIGVQRLFSRAPKEDTAFCNWQTSWWKLEEEFWRYAGERGGI